MILLALVVTLIIGIGWAAKRITRLVRYGQMARRVRQRRANEQPIPQRLDECLRGQGAGSLSPVRFTTQDYQYRAIPIELRLIQTFSAYERILYKIFVWVNSNNINRFNPFR